MTLIREALMAYGHQVILAPPHAMAGTQHPDLILLDFTTPNIPFEEVTRTARGTQIPVIALVNRSTDKVQALNLGADDALSVPWSTLELRARCQALTRHLQATGPSAAPLPIVEQKAPLLIPPPSPLTPTSRRAVQRAFQSGAALLLALTLVACSSSTTTHTSSAEGEAAKPESAPTWPGHHLFALNVFTAESGATRTPVQGQNQRADRVPT
ncbi:response regulator transcription factor [Deinococcus hopiensis]|uniref:response regulator transcription factor n=1 Tax=Deinococcus hopiensis TaxID=309885 RepID=UPI00111C15C8|nr:response regulator transcription factor [Deinococcus hopiensis]